MCALVLMTDVKLHMHICTCVHTHARRVSRKGAISNIYASTYMLHMLPQSWLFTESMPNICKVLQRSDF